ncbi:MAG: ABC transporter ATP-binding protein [Hyphomicrobium sp.]
MDVIPKTNAAQSPVFVARGLSKTYGTPLAPLHALRDVDLDIHSGEFLVLLGPSGSGKSTLLNILGGLDAASSGTAYWRDHDLTKATEGQLTEYRRDHVGFVFQFYNLVQSLTALENVKLVAQVSKNPMTAEEALTLVGLSDRLNSFPSELSGGEQQRVAVARAIVKRPDILLCDEPTGALDAETGRLVLAAISKINNELGTTTVVITHNSAIAAMAHRVIHLSSGRITSQYKNEKQLGPEEISW